MEHFNAPLPSLHHSALPLCSISLCSVVPFVAFLLFAIWLASPRCLDFWPPFPRPPSLLSVVPISQSLDVPFVSPALSLFAWSPAYAPL